MDQFHQRLKGEWPKPNLPKSEFASKPLVEFQKAVSEYQRMVHRLHIAALAVLASAILLVTFASITKVWGLW